MILRAFSIVALSGMVTANADTVAFEASEKDFQLDGQALVVRSGEMHYPRVPPEYWRNRMQTIRAMGLNTVSTYVFWNQHEPMPGHFDFTGQGDVAEFCRTARQEGLKVILRPGPYVCAEWDLGGLPWWLLKDPSIRLRTRNPAFLAATKRYFKALGEQLAPLQITRGGPIILVQIENEYLGYGRDREYLTELANGLKEAGFEVPFFTSDMSWTAGGASGQPWLTTITGGKLPEAFANLRTVMPTGPLMSSEFYTGWYDAWGLRHSQAEGFSHIIEGVTWMLERGISFNLYMAHGGTTFGFNNGGNGPPFRPTLTSYDYGAPITEAGWTTPAYDALRNLLGKHPAKGETLPPVPPRNPVIKLPPMELDEVAPLMGTLPKPRKELRPRPMEMYDQGHGCILYRTTLAPGGGERLVVQEAHDYCLVFLDGKRLGTLDHTRVEKSLVLPQRKEKQTLDLLVEAMGHLHYGTGFYERKGITEKVSLMSGGAPRDLTGWEVFPLPLHQTNLAELKFTKGTTNVPAFYRKRFDLDQTGDTFLDLRAWRKGVVWINGHNLGRYWALGPQQTLYCPGPWLKKGQNEMVVLEMEGSEKRRITGLSEPVLDQVNLQAGGWTHRKPDQQLKLEGLKPALAGSFTPGTEWQRMEVPTVKGRYVCLETLSSHTNDAYASFAELGLVGENGRELPRDAWRVVYADSEEVIAESGGADNLLDANPDTFWHTEWQAKGPKHPHAVVIDLGSEQTIKGLQCLPRRSSANGRIREFRFYVSPTPFPER